MTPIDLTRSDNSPSVAHRHSPCRLEPIGRASMRLGPLREPEAPSHRRTDNGGVGCEKWSTREPTKTYSPFGGRKFLDCLMTMAISLSGPQTGLVSVFHRPVQTRTAGLQRSAALSVVAKGVTSCLL